MTSHPPRSTPAHVPGRPLWEPAAGRASSAHTPGRRIEFQDDDTPVVVSAKDRLLGLLHEGFSLPRPPKSTPARWVPPAETVQLGDLTIPGGLFYYGEHLLDEFGQPDPCLVNPSLAVARHGNCVDRDMGYWPRYDEISPFARRSYLEWLAGGRSHPDADIGYVFLFFYGLERKVLLDLDEGSAVSRDRLAIAYELQRLLDVYGAKSASFSRYARSLLQWVTLRAGDGETSADERFIPRLAREVPFAVLMAVGRRAVEGQKLSANLALTWALSDPRCNAGIAAHRCPEQFAQVFCGLYWGDHGEEGLELPASGPPLFITHMPASSGFSKTTPMTLRLQHVADAQSFDGMRMLLSEYVSRTERMLAPYAAYHSGATGESRSTRERLSALLLPVEHQPPAIRQAFDALMLRLQTGPAVTTLFQLFETLTLDADPDFYEAAAVSRLLERLGVGMEPDPQGGALPDAAEPLVLFRQAGVSEAMYHSRTPSSQVLSQLQILTGVALAGGVSRPAALTAVKSAVLSWEDVSLLVRERLVARLTFLEHKPVAGVSRLDATQKRFLKGLSPELRSRWVLDLVRIVNAQGASSPVQLQALERIYTAMGLAPEQVVHDVFAGSAGGVPPSARAAGHLPSSGGAVPGSFVLDVARVKALQADSEKVSAMLSDIFVDDVGADVHPEPLPNPAVTECLAGEPRSSLAPLLSSLDSSHVRLLQRLLARPAWARSELLTVCAEFDLMPDGAIEQLNEACYDAFNLPFSEGEDPLELNPDLLEQISQ